MSVEEKESKKKKTMKITRPIAREKKNRNNKWTENGSGTETYLNISTLSSALETYKFSMKYFSWAAEFVPVIGFRLDIAAILSPESSKIHDNL